MEEEPDPAAAFGDTVASSGGGAAPDVSLDAGLAETIAPGDPTALASKPFARQGQLAPDMQFGRYRVIEKLGAGAMGVVWRAEDPELGRKVALKLLKRPDESHTERLVREARAMAQVNHPNVVAVYDVGVTGGATFIAMELVQGQSLRRWQIASGRRIPEIVQAYIAAGRGLAAAHRAGVVHRDFKPDNVLVGDDGRVRVTDFGLAAAKASDLRPRSEPQLMSDVNLTTSGSVLGTPAYMSPEQFSGGNVDSRTDQFNFAVALYEALYGERPFGGKSFDELGDNVCAGKVRPAPHDAEVSPALRAIVVRGMAVQPGDRYPTIEHMLAELGRDRARPYRITAVVAAAIAGALVLGLATDYIVRERGESAVRQAFAATGKQIERAGALQAERFQAASALVDQLPPMIALTAQHDAADFGLQMPEEDETQLHELHDLLSSASWKLVRQLGPGDITVADRKGRVVYTSAAPAEWRGELDKMPALAGMLAGRAREAVAAVHYDEPVFAKAKLWGQAPPHGLALMFARAIERNGQIGGLFLQFVDANDVLAGIRLDGDTKLGLVALDGTVAGDVSAGIATATPADGSVVEITRGGQLYQLQSRPLLDATGHPVARVVMAREITRVLSLFPHAIAVFAAAAIAALAMALGATMRARRITGARV